MKPRDPMQTRGSFSKPPEFVRNAEQHEVERFQNQQRQGAPGNDSESTPAPTAEPAVVSVTAQPTSAPAADAPEERQDRTAQIKAWKEEIEKDLDVTLTEENLKNYLFKGQMSLDVSLVPGIMRGAVQTLRIDDLQEIDARMAEVRDQAKFTSKGLENEEAIIALSYAWTHADGKPLGTTPAERETRIRKMGTLFIERASSARIQVDTLIRLALQEKGLLKK